MANYPLIEPRDPFEFRDTGFCADLTRRLADTDVRVTIFLVQNGVLPARAGALVPEFSEFAQTRVEVLAEDFSVREREIPFAQPVVKASALGIVIDRVAEDAKEKL